jgi:hypothetical protein
MECGFEVPMRTAVWRDWIILRDHGADTVASQTSRPEQPDTQS